MAILLVAQEAGNRREEQQVFLKLSLGYKEQNYKPHRLFVQSVEVDAFFRTAQSKHHF